MKNYVELYGSYNKSLSPLERKSKDVSAPLIDISHIGHFDPNATSDKLNLSVPGTYWYQMIINELIGLYEEHPEHLDLLSFSSLFNVIQTRISEEIVSLRKPLGVTGVVLTPGIQRCVVRWANSISTAVKGYRITWWDADTPDVKLSHEQSSDIPTTYIITDLQPEATVHVEIQAYRKFDVQYPNVYSIASHHQTRILLGKISDFESPDPVTNLAAIEGPAGNVKLTWNMPYDLNLSHAELIISLLRRNDKQSTISARYIPLNDLVLGGFNEETIFHLEHNRTFRFEIILHNIYGNKSESRYVDAVPDSEAPNPAFFETEYVTKDSIILGWSATDAADFDKYRLEIYEADGSKLVNTVETRINIDNRNTNPRDIWSDNVTLWVVDRSTSGAPKVFAYNLSTKAPDPDKSFTLTTENSDPWGLVKFGDYFYVSDLADDKLYAYHATSGTNFGIYDSAKDINVNTHGNDSPFGMIVVDSSLFVIDQDDDKIYEYDSSGAKRSEIDLAADNLHPTGIWVNATTRWVAEFDVNDLKLHAYSVANNSRDTDNDIPLDPNNSSPAGVWSDGTTIWVVNINDAKIYAYNLLTKDPDRNNDFNSLGNLVTLGIIEEESTDIYKVINRDTEYYFELTVFDKVGNESSPPARSITLSIDSEPPLPLNPGTYDVTFMDPSTTSFTNYIADQRSFNVSWSWPQAIVENAGSLIIRIRDGINIERDPSVEAPYFSTAFELDEINFDFHFQDGGYYEYIISSQIDPVTLRRKNAHRFTMTPEEALWQRYCLPGEQLEYIFEFYLIDRVGNESSAVKVAVAPDYTAPALATGLSLEPVINFVYPKLLSTVSVNEVSQSVSSALLENSVDEFVSLGTVIATADKIEFRLVDRTLTWKSNLDDYWFRLLDSNDNELAVLNLGGHAEYNAPSLMDFSGNGETGNYLVWNDPPINKTPGTVHKIEIYNYKVHPNSYGVVKLDFINSNHRQYGYNYGFTWPEGLITSGDKEGAEVSIKLFGDRRNYNYYTGNSINTGTYTAFDATSNGKTLWLLDVSGPGWWARAYTLATKKRDSGHDVEFIGSHDFGVIGPKGIYTNGVVFWVLTSTQIITYDVFGNRVEGHIHEETCPVDFNLHADNDNPKLLCGDGTTVWVCDVGTTKKLYAYVLRGGDRVVSKEINLHAANTNPVGMTTDGVTIWVADGSDDHIYAYTINSSGGTRNTTEELSVNASVSLGGIWTDSVIFWIADNSRRELLEYSTGAFIDTFTIPRTSSNDTITGTKLTTEEILMPVKFTVGRDGSSDIYGYDHSGSKTVGSVDLDYNLLPTKLYKTDSIKFQIDYVQAIATLSGNSNDDPKGIWSDGITLWVIDGTDNQIYAYDLNSGVAKSNDYKFTNLATSGNTDPRDLWSNGSTMWVVDGTARNIFAYTVADSKTRDNTKEFSLHIDNGAPKGIWSDGITMWVSDGTDAKIYAYTLDNGIRDSDKDFNTLSAAGNDNPGALWSDGVTMWVADETDHKIYAYAMSDQARDTTKEFNRSSFNAGNTVVSGIWSDGKTIRISDNAADEIYVYNYWGNTVKRFITDATGATYYLEFQDIMSAGLEFSAGTYGNQYSDLRAEIINESSYYALDHNYIFDLGGHDGSGSATEHLPQSVISPKDYRKQLADGAASFNTGDEITVNFYSSELSGKGSAERGFYWLTSGTNGDQAEIKVKVIDLYGNSSIVTNIYTPPTTIATVSALVDNGSSVAAPGMPIYTDLSWVNPNALYLMRLEYYYKTYTGGSGASLSDQVAPSVTDSDWFIVPGGPTVTNLKVSRSWELDITERSYRKWEFGIRARDALGNVSDISTITVDPSNLSDLDPIAESDISIESGHSAFKITWTNPEAPKLYEVKLRYTVGSSVSEITIADSDPTTQLNPVKQDGNRTQEYVLDLGTGVSAATGYSFTIILVDLFSGSEETTKSGTFDLDRTGPTPPVLDSVTNPAPGRVSLSYTASTDTDAHSQLRFSRETLDSTGNAVSGTLVENIVLTSNPFEYTLTSLKKYRFRLYAYDTPFDATSYARRNSTEANIFRELYVAAVPVAISSLTVATENIKSDRVTLDWGSYTGWNDAGPGINRKFQVRRSDPVSDQPWSDWVDVAHTANSYVFTGLNYGTEYTFAIKVINNAGFESTITQSTAVSTLRLGNPVLINNQNLSGNVIPINTGADDTIEASLNLTWDALSEQNWVGGDKDPDESGSYRHYDLFVSNDAGKFWTVFPNLKAYILQSDNSYLDLSSYRVNQIYTNKSQFKVKMVAGSGSKFGLSDNRAIDTATENINKLPADFYSAGSNVVLLINKAARSVYGYRADDGVRSLSNEFKLDAINTDPLDIYSDNDTIWILDATLNKILAYSVDTYARDEAKDLTLVSVNSNATGMVSDGTTVWVTDRGTTKRLFAYNLSGKYRVANKDITLNSGNSNPGYLTTDGSTIWVSDNGTIKRLYAYDLRDGVTYGDYISGKTITLHSNAIVISGMANDGTTLWVADNTGSYVYAYTISSTSHDSTKDFNVAITGTLDITGLHWLVDSKVTDFYLDNAGANSELIIDFSGYSRLYDLNWDDYDLYGMQVTRSDGDIIYNNVLPKLQTGINNSGLWVTTLNSKLDITADEYLYFTFYKFSDFDNVGDNTHLVRLRAHNGYLSSITDKITVDDVKVPGIPYSLFTSSGPAVGELSVYYEFPEYWNDGGVLDSSRFIKLVTSAGDTTYLYPDSELIDTVQITVGNSGSTYGYSAGNYGTIDSAHNSLPGVLFSDNAAKTITGLYDGGTNQLTIIHAAGTLNSLAILKRYSVLVKDANDQIVARFNFGGDNESSAPVINDSGNSYTLTLTKLADLFSDSDTATLTFEIYAMPKFVIRRDPNLANLTKISAYSISAFGQSAELALTSGLAVMSGTLVALTSGVPTIIPADLTITEYLIDHVNEYLLSLSLSWTSLTDTEWNGGNDSTRFYEIHYRESGGSGWSPEVRLDSRNTEYSINGLKALTRYEVQIRAINGTDATAWSSTEISDSVGIPEVAEFNITATDITSSSIVVKWNTLRLWNDNNLHQDSRGFDLEWRTEGSSYWVARKLDVGVSLDKIGKNKQSYGYGANYEGSEQSALLLPSELFVGDPGDQTVTEISNYYVNSSFNDPIGVCSDASTMWIVSEADNTKLYAYNVDSKERDTSKDITLISANNDPKDIFTDGSTIWVVDATDAFLYAYIISTRAYTSGQTFNVLGSAGNSNPISLWSDGVTMYVLDSTDNKVYAYRMSNKSRDSAKEFNLHSDNANPAGMWSDGKTMWISDTADGKLYAYTLSGGARDSDKDFNTLSAVDNTDPRGIWSDGDIMWVCDASNGIVFAYRQPDLPMASRYISRDIFLDSSNANPTYICNDGTTIWVVDAGTTKKLFAYIILTGKRDGSKEFNLHSANANPTGIWTNGVTIWVADNTDNKIYAYSLADGSRVSGSDINAGSGNGDFRGIWSAGGLMWVADDSDNQIYAYKLHGDKSLVSGEYITTSTLNSAGNSDPAGIWSDGTTMWVVDSNDDRVYAYNLGYNTVNNALKFDLNAVNSDPVGITGSGNVIWVLDATDNILYAYSLIPPALHSRNYKYENNALISATSTANLYYHNSDNDYNNLEPANRSNLTGTWSNGTTIWISDYTDATIYAFNLADYSRDSAKDFTTLAAAGNNNPRDIWSDGTTMWVVDDVDDKIYAYVLTSGGENASSFDFNTLSGITAPYGIWSDGETMWVVNHAPGGDSSNSKLYAYNMTTKARDSSKDFNNLHTASNANPIGLWSDGVTMYVSDHTDRKIYAYNMSSKARDSNKDFNTLSAAGNTNPGTIWSDGVTMWVCDLSDNKIYAYNMNSKARNTSQDFNTLLGSVDGIWSDGETMWVSHSNRSALYGYDMISKSINPANIFGNFVAAGNAHPRDIWSDGIIMWVLDSTDGKIYAYTIQNRDRGSIPASYDDLGNRDQSKDFDTLSAAGNNNPYGIYSDGSTMYVIDTADTKVYAYNMYDKRRILNKDINLHSDNADPTGIWGSGDTIWIGDSVDDKVYAYSVVLGYSRDSSKDFDTLSTASNENPFGLWSDGVTMWVSDTTDAKIYAYNVSTKARDPSNDFNTLAAAGCDEPRGIWSDGITMWVCNDTPNRLFAFNMSTKARDSSKERVLPSSPSNYRPNGLTSDGITLWMVDWASQNYLMYAFNLSTLNADASRNIYVGSQISLRGCHTDGTTMWACFRNPGHSNISGRILAYDVVSRTRNPAKDFDILSGAGNDHPTDIWSDGATMWVVDGVNDKIYAYNMISRARESSKDINLLSAAGNNKPAGMWESGSILRILDNEDNKIYGYQLPQSAVIRLSGQDFNTLSGAGNNHMQGMWSNGTTMWISDASDDKLYAYDMNTKARDSTKDFNTLRAAGNTDIYGIWANATTMWVSDNTDNKLYAYDMNTKARDATKDFNTLSAAGNNHPYGIWSDGTTMWVSDNVDNKIYAYKMSDKSRDSAKDFNTLSAAGNTAPYGIWSDRSTMWVADTVDNKIYAYNMGNKARNSALDINNLDVSNSEPRGVWSDGTNMWIIDFNAKKIFAYSLTRPAARNTAADSSSLIYPGNTNPTSIWSNGTTMWVADSGSSKLFAYSASSKARDSARDFTVTRNVADNLTGTWSDGTTIWISDYTDAKIYAYNLSDYSRDSTEDFNTLYAAGNRNPRDIWSDGTTMWVVDDQDDKIYAYRMNDKSRDASKDFNTLISAGNRDPYGIWSDGTTMNVVDTTDNKVYAYNMSDKARRSIKDFNLHSSNADPTGIWSDGSTVWIADDTDDKVYAYGYSVGRSRNASKDFNTLSAAGNNNPVGIWANTTTMWVADANDSKVYAYNISTKARDSSKDFNGATGYAIWSDGVTMWISGTNLLAYNLSSKARDSSKDFNTLYAAGNRDVWGMWSDGVTMYVCDRTDSRIYAYNMSTKQRDSSKDFINILGDIGSKQIYGIWSDGETMWVVNQSPGGGYEHLNNLYAYNMNTKARDPSKDFTTLRAAGNLNPVGLWSDGVTMYVSDYGDDKIYAYHLSDYPRDSSKDINLLSAAGNNKPAGMWGDGTTLRILDNEDDRIYGYSLLPNNHYLFGVERTRSGSEVTAIQVTETASGLSFTTLPNKLPIVRHTSNRVADFSCMGKVGNQVWAVYEIHQNPGDRQVLMQVTLDSNGLTAGQIYTPDSSSPGSLQVLSEVAMFELGGQLHAIDNNLDVFRYTFNDSARTYNLTRLRDRPSHDTSWGAIAEAAGRRYIIANSAASQSRTSFLMSILNDDFTGSAITRNNLQYNTVVAIEAAIAIGNNVYAFSLTPGRKVTRAALSSDGLTATVSEIDSRTPAGLQYISAISVFESNSRNTSADSSSLNVPGNTTPTGTWSNGTTMWVVDSITDKIFAYRLSDGARETAQDFDTLSAAGNRAPRDLWSNGTTMWVSDDGSDKVYAYNMNTKARDSSKDFNSLQSVGNTDPKGIWSDGAIMWVVDSSDDRVYAYRISNKARDTSSYITALASAGNNDPTGIWSDGTNVWIADDSDHKIYSYRVPTANTNPGGIWVDYATFTVYIADTQDDKIHAYGLFNGARKPDLNISLASIDKTTIHGMTGDGTTIWIAVTHRDSRKLYAYTIATRIRNASKDITLSSSITITGLTSDNTSIWVGADNTVISYNISSRSQDYSKYYGSTLLTNAGNRNVKAIYTDGTTMWIADSDGSNARIYAYTVGNNPVRDSAKDITVLQAAGNLNPGGMYVADSAMLVLDRVTDKIYAYNLSSEFSNNNNNMGSDSSSSGVATINQYSPNLAEYNYLSGVFVHRGIRIAWAGSARLRSKSELEIYNVRILNSNDEILATFNLGGLNPQGEVTIHDNYYLLDGSLTGLFRDNLGQSLKFEFFVGTNSLESDALDFTVSDLSFDQPYQFRLRAENHYGLSDWAYATIATIPGTPVDIAGLAVTTRKTAELVIGWTGTSSDSDWENRARLGNRYRGIQAQIVQYTPPANPDFTNAEIIDAALDYEVRLGEVTVTADSDSIFKLKNSVNLGIKIGAYPGTGVITGALPSDLFTDSSLTEQDRTLTALYTDYSKGALNQNFDGSNKPLLFKVAAANASWRTTDWGNYVIKVYAGPDDKLVSVFSMGAETGIFSVNSAADNAGYNVLARDLLGWLEHDSLTRKLVFYNITSPDTYTFSGLTFDTNYGIRIRRYNQVNYSPNWIALNTSTIYEGAGPPTLTVFPITRAQIAITWTPPDEFSSPIIGYQLQKKVGSGSYSDVIGGENLPAHASYFIDPNKGGGRAGGHDFGVGGSPWGMHTDGTTIWVAQGVTGILQAYNYVTKARDSSKDFNLGFTSPDDICSDGTTMWVVNGNADTIVAFKMSDRSRDSAKDIAPQGGNGSPSGAWTDGVTMWVSDPTDNYMYAYNVSTKQPDGSKQFYLHRDNIRARGIWSNGTIMWVADIVASKVFAYNLSTKTRDSTKEFDVSWMANPIGVCSYGSLMWVMDETTKRAYAFAASGQSLTIGDTYTYRIRAKISGHDGSWSSEGALTLQDGAPNAITDLTAVARKASSVDLSWSDPDSGGKPYIAGYYVEYREPPAFTVRDANKDFNTLQPAGNNRSFGIWSNGTTMWVIEGSTTTFYAYNMTTKARDSGKDIALASGNNKPRGIWSDGTIMWVANQDGKSIYVYRMADGAHTSTLTASANIQPRGLWTNGVTMWVADNKVNTVYAYNVSDMSRDSAKDITLTSENGRPADMWSDRTTLWIADTADGKVYAYNLANRTYDSAKDISLDAANADPWGLWANSTTMWVGDKTNLSANKIFAYSASGGGWNNITTAGHFPGAVELKIEFIVGVKSGRHGYGPDYGSLLFSSVREVYFNGRTLYIVGLPRTWFSARRMKLLINDVQIRDVSTGLYFSVSNPYSKSSMLDSNGQARLNDRVTIYIYNGTEVDLISARELIQYPEDSAYTLSGLKNNTPYQFRVYAVNSYGISAPSNTALATTLLSSVPDSPTILAYKYTGSTITLDWVVPSYTGTDAITEYYVYWTVNSATRVPTQKLTVVGATNFTLTTATGWASTSNATTRIWITSRSIAGESAVPLNPLVIRHVTVPGVPRNLAGSVSDNQITLSWLAPSSGSSPTGYTIIRSKVPNNENYQEIVASNITGTSYIDEDLDFSTTYYYKIAGSNLGGLGNYSGEITVTTAARDNSERRPNLPSIYLSYVDVPKDLGNGTHEYTRLVFSYTAGVPSGAPLVTDYEILAGDYPYKFIVNAGAPWVKSITVRAKNSNGWGPAATKRVSGTAPS